MATHLAASEPSGERQALPRLHCPLPLAPGLSIRLPAAAARHVQVLRLQPGEGVTLFGGLHEGQAGAAQDDPVQDREFDARILSIGRSEVQVLLGPGREVSREAGIAVDLALGLLGSERMDWLVEKATELGARSIQPLITQRAQLRPDEQRSLKKARHWQAIAAAACEQCGRNRVPQLHPVLPFPLWLAAQAQLSGAAQGWLLDPGAPADSLAQARLALAGPVSPSVLLLSGPEGGLTEQERTSAYQAGFRGVALGPRILRAETAPLALLATLTLQQ